MPILDIQRRFRELGRIRTGIAVGIPGRTDGRRRPQRLETFRLTSPSRELIEHAAQAYGGTATPWGDQWEVVTAAATLDIYVPPGEPLSQWHELWTEAGCVRRCDGRRETISDQPCLCPADPGDRRDLAQRGEACKPTTRLNVFLTELPDLGTWRLESHGYYAAVELAGAADVLLFAAESGRPIPARLRLDQRTRKIPGKPTNHYAVPVIEFYRTRLVDLLEAPPGDRPQLAAGTPALPAIAPPATSDLRGPVLTAGDNGDAAAAPIAPSPSPMTPPRPIAPVLGHPTRAETADLRRGSGGGPAETTCGAASDPELGPVELCAHPAGHTWPDGTPSPHRASSGTTWSAR